MVQPIIGDSRHLKNIYSSLRSKIVSRLNEFSQAWETRTDLDIFAELIFCILTPQSRAKSCWVCVERLRNKGLLCRGDIKDISRELPGTRFHNKKAEYIVEAQRRFSNSGKISIKSRLGQFSDACILREWLVRNIKGIGYKEASHFLRNIGSGENLAILDRHILKNLKSLRVIDEIPDSLTKAKYLEIEKRMKEFAKGIKIPVSHLDFVLWYKGAGEIFK